MSSCKSRVCFHCIPKLSLTISTLIVFLSLFDGCSHPVEPPTPPQQPAKDPRTYTWTVDTLFFSPAPGMPGQTDIEDLWGANDTLLYAVCYDGWGGVATLWKYNGKNWKFNEVNAMKIGAGSPIFSFNAIKGFSERDIYVFGQRLYYNPTPTSNYTSQVCAAHFNGSVWQEVSIPNGEYIGSVDHDSPTMIFCGGKNGQLFQFDGSRWSVDTVRLPYLRKASIDVRVACATPDNGVMIQTFQLDTVAGVVRYHFLKYQNNQITPIDSSTFGSGWGGESFWKSKEGNLFSCGWNGVFRLSGAKWIQMKQTNENFYSIYGVSEKHLFVAGTTSVYFYDGSSWTKLNTGVTKAYAKSKVWCTSNEVFVAFSDGFRTIVWHGK